MEKILQPSTGVQNVAIGQQATHNLRKGPFYHHVTYFVTVWKTALTAGFTSATLQDALAAIEVRVNTTARRSFLAIELEAIQGAYGTNFLTTASDNLLNDGITAQADTVNATGANINGPGGVIPPASTQRPTTFEFTIYFSEPSRNSYTARRFFGLPTSWKTGKTVDIQIALSVPANAGISNPIITAEEFIEFTTGPHLKSLANGQPDTTSPEVLPFVHFWRIPANYAANVFSITDWGNVAGQLQQISVFGQNNDFLQSFKLKADNVTKRDTTKGRNDRLCERYDWNAPVPTLPAPYNQPNVTHIALDVSDDVTDWLNFNAYKNVELAFQLSQAAAANKAVVAIVQAYDLYQLPA